MQIFKYYLFMLYLASELTGCGINPCTGKQYSSVSNLIVSQFNCSPDPAIVSVDDKHINTPAPPPVKQDVTKLTNIDSPVLSDNDENTALINGVLPITIANGSTSPVNNFVVTSGVPFAIGQLKHVEKLRLITDDNFNAPVAAQFNPMVSWPDGSIKVVLVSFVPTVSSNKTSYNRYKILYQNTETTSSPAPVNPLKSTDNGSQLIIDNGVATFFINKKIFTVFDQVKINNVNQMAKPGDIVFTDNLTHNDFKTSLATNYTLTQTETGPIRMTLLATGRAKAVSGTNKFGENTLVTVKLWMTFYANSGRVDLKYTWIDDIPRANRLHAWNTGTHYIEIKSNSINLPLIPTASTYTFGGVNTTYNGSVSGTNFLLQDATVRDSEVTHGYASGYEYLFNYSGVGSSSASEATGVKDSSGNTLTDFIDGRAPGWMDVTGDSVGITAGIKDFWQNFPNKLSINDQGLLQIYVQPDESKNMFFSLAPGVGKTHDLYLDFHAGTDTVAASNRFMMFKELPLIRASGLWYANSKVFGPITAPNSNSSRWDSQIDYQFTCSLNRLNCSLYNISYGKRDYGDYIMGNHPYMFANQHYEDAHGWLLQYLRLGRKKYFNWSESYAKHHYDLDVMHTTWPGYLTGYPAGMIHWHGGNEHETSGYEDGHIVPGGIDELYLITGDPRALDVSKEQGDWVAYWTSIGGMKIASEFAGDPIGGVEYERAQAWGLYTVLKTYESTNDIKYWNAATIAIKNTIDWWKMSQSLVVFNPGFNDWLPITSGSTTIALNSWDKSTQINVGYSVSGPGIPGNTTVTAVYSDHVVISNAATSTQSSVQISMTPVVTTRQSVQSQALWFESINWNNGNGYFLSTMKTDNTLSTNIAISSDPKTWVYQNHVPVSWMAAYLLSSIIRYNQNLQNIGGTYSASINYRGLKQTISTDTSTINEMLIQTTNILSNHNFMGSPAYPSVFPWMSNIGNNLWSYSVSPDRIAANPNSTDGDSQLPWPLLYAASLQPSQLLQTSRWAPQWPTLQSKWRGIASLSQDITSSNFVLPGNNTGYQGAALLWNMPYAMSLMSP